MKRKWFFLTKKTLANLLLVTIVFFTLILRLNYGRDLLLSGDEVGVGVLQATGNWSEYLHNLKLNEKTDISQVKQFLLCPEDKSTIEVIKTMRSDRLHPPLYFIMLHFLIKNYGTGILLLRTFSVIISLLSLITVYFLGKELYNERTGLLTAIFMALSAYCLEYSVMVRMYPLAMWFSLLSTLLVVIMIKYRSFHFKSITLYLYILVAVLGIYTYYSFAILLFTQFVFVLFFKHANQIRTSTLITTWSIIFLLFLPWIFPMFEGITTVPSKNYYFKGSYSMPEIIQYFFNTIFLPDRYKLFEYSPLTGYFIVMAVIILTVVLVIFSIKNLLKSGLIFAFWFSVFLYILLFILSDKVLETRIMMFDRQHYFVVPVLILFLASVFFSNPKIRTFSWIGLVLFAVLFASGLNYRYHNKSIFDGPYYFGELKQYIEKKTAGNNEKEIVLLFNMKEKRYLLPFVYNTTRNFDLVVMPGGLPDSSMNIIKSSGKYRKIILVNIDVSPEKRTRLQSRLIPVDSLTLLLDSIGYHPDNEPYFFDHIEQMNLMCFTR